MSTLFVLTLKFPIITTESNDGSPAPHIDKIQGAREDVMQQYPDGISSGSVYLDIDDLWAIFEFLDHLPDEDTSTVFRAVPKLSDRFGHDRMTCHDLWQFWDHTRDVGTTEYRVAIVLMTYAA